VDTALQLFDDIKEAIELSKQNYMLGSVILLDTEDGNNNKVLEVVDGQQRLTNLLLLLCQPRLSLQGK